MTNIQKMDEWVVIASRAGAAIFRVKKEDKKPEFILNFSYSLGRARNRTMQTDKTALRCIRSEKNPHDQAAVQLARKLTKFLYKKWLSKDFGKVKIIAEPKFIGKIKAEVDSHLESHIEWIEKDLKKIPRKKWKISYA